MNGSKTRLTLRDIAGRVVYMVTPCPSRIVAPVTMSTCGLLTCAMMLITWPSLAIAQELQTVDNSLEDFTKMGLEDLVEPDARARDTRDTCFSRRTFACA